MSAYRCEFRRYRRLFQQPLRTHHGTWAIREGILVRLTRDTGEVSFGEIAPIPWFGTETPEEAWSLCQALGPTVTQGAIAAIPATHPACQFGLESALLGLRSPRADIPRCHLLPTGPAALSAWQNPVSTGVRTLKVKVGVGNLEDEIPWLQALTRQLPEGVKLRLDANGGLTPDQAKQWLAVCDRQPNLEFLEQPLGPDQLDLMLDLAAQFRTPLALDESVATLQQLQDCYDRGWRGIVVIKPAIAGFPSQVRQFCQQHALDVVVSSALETVVGQQAGLALATDIGTPSRAVGYGIDHWFANASETPWFFRPPFEELWRHLPPPLPSVPRMTG